ncbi:MAG: hypothetical protein QW782_03635 [Candidatus Bathyarchaeia archaeon]
MKISITVNENFMISDILAIAIKYDLKIMDIKYYEPTLEEVFMTLVGGREAWPTRF